MPILSLHGAAIALQLHAYCKAIATAKQEETHMRKNKIIIKSMTEAYTLKDWCDKNKVNYTTALHRWKKAFGEKTSISESVSVVLALNIRPRD